MHTVTFYSYKGGVGRTLCVVNVAKYLAQLQMSVFVLDFDLEAPGVHYKLGEHGKALDVQRGLVDILSAFATKGSIPERLEDYVLEVPAPVPSASKIHLLPAGDAPSSGYWKKLSRINWHALFYSEEPDGIPLFLELKTFIAETYAPDFLLIDARTGITEMGGVATTVLSDQVVCLMLPTQEHLGRDEGGHARHPRRFVRGGAADQPRRGAVAPATHEEHGRGFRGGQSQGALERSGRRSRDVSGDR